MSSTFTTNLRLELQATGEHSTTWGSTLNTGAIALIEAAISGMATLPVTGGTDTLTTANGSTDQARCMAIKCTGVLGSAETVVAPAVGKMYVIWNATSGAYSLTVKPTGGTGVTVTQGEQALIWTDGSTAYKIAETNSQLIAWTPVLAFGGGSTGITYSFQSGNYVRTGRLVHVEGRIVLTSKGSSTGTATITGLPFASAFNETVVGALMGGVTFTGQTKALITQGQTYINVYQHTEAGTVSLLTDANFTNTSDAAFTADYLT